MAKSEDWQGIQYCPCGIKRTHKGKTSIEQRYYSCSERLSAEVLLSVLRSHWGVEYA